MLKAPKISSKLRKSRKKVFKKRAIFLSKINLLYVIKLKVIILILPFSRYYSEYKKKVASGCKFPKLDLCHWIKRTVIIFLKKIISHYFGHKKENKISESILIIIEEVNVSK